MATPIGHRPSMSSGGSIASRKRVGSVSQRGNDMGLTPLDIQSIQMPLNPQNSLALKTAALASTKSLYQTCSALRKRLRCVEDFAPFLEQPSSAEPLDVVTHMCHMFRLGSPLCHIYNLLIPAFVDPESPLYADLPRPKHIEYDFPAFHDCPDGIRNWAKRPENAKMCQKYIAMFCMAMKQRQEEGRWEMEIWALHELWGKSGGADADGYESTGLMKVFQTVEAMLDYLPESAMSPLSPNTPYTASSSNHALGHMSRQSYDIPFSMGGMGSGAGAVAHMAATMNGGVHIEEEASPITAGNGEDMVRGLSKSSADVNAFKSVEELVASEKSYVQELEILVRCSSEMLEYQLVSTDTNHQIFSNLPKILEFHRKFLIKLETEYEHISEGRGPKAWAEGRWGRPFVTSEREFDCYGPYCANYLDAITIVTEQMPNLLRIQDLPEDQQPCLHPERELQAFMIKPIQRITKYGLLLDAILHATAKHDYPYRTELEEGAAAVRRIAASINEVTDFKAKQATVRELQDRVEDWKGHELDKFGDLWLDDHFTVIKADQPREYHVFLFEKMMLCCKEILPERKKGSKNSSMLRKDKTASKSSMPDKRKLALKGRIFVSNIQRATVTGESSGNYNPRLTIAWTVPHRNENGWPDEVEDSFVMAGKSEDQLQRWADKVMELANEERAKQAERKAQGRMSERHSASDGRYQQSSFAPPTPASEQPPWVFPPPLPGQNDEFDEDQSGFRSGRTTPSMSSSSTYVSYSYGHQAGRRVQSQQAPPADRQAELRARAMTEDQFGPSMSQWRSQQPPPLPRLTSAMSAMSTISANSEASFGSMPSRAPGRYMSQSSRLGRSGEIDEDLAMDASMSQSRGGYNRYAPSRGMARAPSHGITPSVPYPHPPPLRSRSASSPNVYQIPKVSPAPMPPVPQSAWTEPSPVLATSSSSTLVGGTAYFTKRMSGGGKRSSGESHSTETSETSSQQSPATPYGMVPGDGRGATPVSRQNSQDTDASAQTMLVRVRCAEDQFVISVPEAITFDLFYHKVLKKIRICARSNVITDSVQIKWIDADNDEVTVKCDADIEAMFGECRDSGANCVNIVAR